MVNLESILKFTSPFFKTYTPDNTQDLVLFLGFTGAGKSTAVNYLLGHKFVIGEGGNAVPEDPNVALPAYAADSAGSVTSYPAIYTLENVSETYNYALCDCPGLADSRGAEVQIGISLCMETLIQRSGNIRAIGVVVDYATIVAARALPFRNLISSIGAMVKDSDYHSVYFIFDRIGRGVTKKYLVGKLTSILQEEEGDLQKILVALKDQGDKPQHLVVTKGQTEVEKKLYEEKVRHERNIGILKHLLKNPAINILMIDVFDEGQSRDELLSLFFISKNIKKSILSFSSSEESRRSFEDILFSNFSAYDAIREEYNREKKVFAELTDTLAKDKALIRSTEDRIKAMQLNPPSVQNDPQLSALHAQELKIEAEIASTKINIATKEKLKAEAMQTKSALDSSAHVFYKYLEKSYDIDGIFGNDTIYSYNGIPFTDVEVTGATGDYHIKTNQPSSGAYRAKYKRGFWDSNSAYPTVKVMVQKRHHPDNATKIHDAEESVRKANSEIASLEEKIRNLKDDLLAAQKKVREKTAEKRFEHSLSIEKLGNQNTKVKGSIDATSLKLGYCADRLTKAEQTRNAKIDELRPLSEIACYIDFNEKRLYPLMVSFFSDIGLTTVSNALKSKIPGSSAKETRSSSVNPRASRSMMAQSYESSNREVRSSSAYRIVSPPSKKGFSIGL